MRYVKIIVSLILVLHMLVFAGTVYAYSGVQNLKTSVLASDNTSSFKVDDYTSDRSDGEKQSAFSGSGFFITPNVVVTCNHIINGASKIEIVYNNEIKLSGVVIGHDNASDLALVRVSGIESMVRPLALADSSRIRQGSRVYAIGFPLPIIMGMQPKISEGLISGMTGLQDDLRVYQISAPVQPGNSGGPLLNEQAKVVGVVSASLDAVKMMGQGIMPQNVNFAVKSNNICSLTNYCRLEVAFNFLQYDDKVLSAADVMDIARKAVVLVVATK